MLRYLAGFSNVFGPLRVFDSITFRVIVGIAMGFFLSLFWGEKFIAWMKNRRAVEDVTKPDSQKLHEMHEGKKGTPTMGGVMILGSMVCTILLACDLTNGWVLITLAVMLSFGALGFVDDYVKLTGRGKQGLSKSQKFLVQGFLAALAAWGFSLVAGANATQLLIPFTKWSTVHPDLSYAYFALFIFVIVGSSNAVNLTDGLDGLASGVSIMVALCYTVLAYVVGNTELCKFFRIPNVVGSGELAIICAALAGSVMGFLWFNAHPARVFMGDTGSLAIGATIAFVALVIKHELVLVLAGGIFVIEALSVIIQVVGFRLTGKRIFKIAPFHHHLQFCGWHENHVVVRLWMLGAICAALALATLKMH